MCLHSRRRSSRRSSQQSDQCYDQYFHHKKHLHESLSGDTAFLLGLDLMATNAHNESKAIQSHRTESSLPVCSPSINTWAKKDVNNALPMTGSQRVQDLAEIHQQMDPDSKMIDPIKITTYQGENGSP